jgi:hypothetical protein
MKRIFLATTLLSSILFCSDLSAQNNVHVSPSEYEQMKQNGTLNTNTNYLQTPTNPNFQGVPFDLHNSNQGNRKVLNPYCFIPPDSSFTMITNSSGTSGTTGWSSSSNDDTFLGPIALPFGFCFYNTTYNSFYINTNGNITFTASYTPYSAQGFPNNSTAPMIAPFWTDVDFPDNDTDPGHVYYQINPTNAIITWSKVGYYANQTDKRNTFQVIITDGNDPVLPPGNNVGFRYQDMQWTTGAASCGLGTPSPCTYNGNTYTCGGTGGFCGAGAVVGANQNDGVNYVQFGQFDHPGNDFVSPFAFAGVDWLDFQTLNFNWCNPTNSQNVPPVINAPNICGDTLRVCINDTVLYNVGFLSPEPGQNTTITFNPVQGSGFTTISNNAGNVATSVVQFVASASNLGTNILQYIATDDGTPVANTVFNLVINVLDVVLNPVITGPSQICQGQTATLGVSGGPYDAYNWSTNQTTDEISAGPGVYQVTVDSGGCSKQSPPFTLSPFPLSPVNITGVANICEGDSTLLTANPTNYAAYQWTPAIGNTATEYASALGNYTVTITDQNGCNNTSAPFTLSFDPNPFTLTGNNPFCLGDSVQLTVTPPKVSYQWSNGDITQSSWVNTPTVSVTFTNSNGCVRTENITLTVRPLPLPDFSPTSQCEGDTIFFLDQTTIATGSVSGWAWDFGNGTNSNLQNPAVLLPAGTYQVSLLAISNNNCRDTVIKSVKINKRPKAGFVATPLCFGKVFFQDTTLAGDAPLDSIFWNLGDNTTSVDSAFYHIYKDQGSGTYDVQLFVVDSNGCADTVVVPVTTKQNLNFSVIPNIITPNGDGINEDMPLVPGIDPALVDECYNLTFKVFNRWGNKVFESNTAKSLFTGKGLNEGVYFWILEAKGTNGSEIIDKGTVTISGLK